MAVLVVAYSLKSPGKDYGPFFAALKGSGAWMHYIDDCWLVDATLTADQLAKKLYPYITNTDRLLVMRVTSENQGWLPADAWTWINERKYY
jgi:hypothetical protein